jgi:hypothetical protein
MRSFEPDTIDNTMPIDRNSKTYKSLMWAQWLMHYKVMGGDEDSDCYYTEWED